MSIQHGQTLGGSLELYKESFAYSNFEFTCLNYTYTSLILSLQHKSINYDWFLCDLCTRLRCYTSNLILWLKIAFGKWLKE